MELTDDDIGQDFLTRDGSVVTVIGEKVGHYLCQLRYDKYGRRFWVPPNGRWHPKASYEEQRDDRWDLLERTTEDLHPVFSTPPSPIARGANPEGPHNVHEAFLASLGMKSP